jgi:hypothetical protein
MEPRALNLARGYFATNQPDGARLTQVFASIGDDPTKDAWVVNYKHSTLPLEHQPTSHTHTCEWCHKQYVHTHVFYSTSHKHHKGECPNTECSAFHPENKSKQCNTVKPKVVKPTATTSQAKTNSARAQKVTASKRPGLGFIPFVKAKVESKPKDNVGFINIKSANNIPISLSEKFTKKKKNVFFCLRRISKKLASTSTPRPAARISPPTDLYQDLEVTRVMDRLKTSSIDLALLSSALNWVDSQHSLLSYECLVASQAIRRAGVSHLKEGEKTSLKAALHKANYPGSLTDLYLHPQVTGLARTIPISSFSVNKQIDVCCSRLH